MADQESESPRDRGARAGGQGAAHPDRVGVVLAGAGARGAYEAGMLSVLLPVLEECHQRPKIFIGTSAGAINAVLFASLAHLPAQQAADKALQVWRGITKNKVLDPVLLQSLPMGLIRYAGGSLNLSDPLSGLLDTGPLLKTLRSEINWERLHANARDSGVLEAVAVAATDCRTRRTAIFAEGPAAMDLPPYDEDRAIDYYRTEPLTAEHVVASAAIPVVFHPVRIKPGGSWYMDGGVRLNAPIKPAVQLEVDRVVVIATKPARYLPPNNVQRSEPAPSIQDTFAQLLDGALADRMIEDITTLDKINSLVAGGADAKSRGGRRYSTIEYLFGGPQPGSLDELGQLATIVYAKYFRGLLRKIRNPDLTLLNSILEPGATSGELLSYVFFRPEFIEAAIELGQDHAQQIIHGKNGEKCAFWSSAGDSQPTTQASTSARHS